MAMSYAEYIEHYFSMPDFLIFLVLACVFLCVVYVIFYLYAKAMIKNENRREKEFYSLSERFYELIFSGGSIIGFMAIYYLINRFVTDGAFRQFWDSYKDYLLLILMIISILFNTFLDHVVIRLKHLDRDAMASIRLTGMLYMILIFCYIKFIYEDDNYDMFIAYFLTLMIGRFVYFDASFKDFLNCIKGAFNNIFILFLALVYLSGMCAYGYSDGYLLKHNGVITNVFFTHLFMFVAIFLLRFIPKLFFKDKDNNDKKRLKPRPIEDEEEFEVDLEILDL